MWDKYPYVLLIVFASICIVIGWVSRGVSNNSNMQNLHTAMAWGFEEEKQVWNRIRVNSEGKVICAKE